MSTEESGRARNPEKGGRSGNGGRGGRGRGRGGREGGRGRSGRGRNGRGGRASSGREGSRGISSNRAVAAKPPPKQQQQQQQQQHSQEVDIPKCTYCDMDHLMCLQVGFVLQVCPVCRCVAYCNDVCRNKHKVDCGALLAATQTPKQAQEMANDNAARLKKQPPPTSSKAPRGKAAGAGAFDALLDDDDDGDGDEEEDKVQTQQTKPAVRPVSSKSSTKSSNKPASDIYAKMGKALAGTTTTTKPRDFRPVTLPSPTRSGRTALGQKLDFTQLLVDVLVRDMVVHHDPRGSMFPTEQVCDFTGVFEPNPLLSARLSIAVFQRSMEKTLSLLKLFGSGSPEADYRLRERGIFLQSPSTPSPLFLLLGTQKIGLTRWTQWYLADTELLMNPGSTPIMCSTSGPRVREMDFWTDKESLYWRPIDAFLPWMTQTQLPLFLAVTPVETFRRAIELAEMPTSPPAIKAPDYEYWNKSLVLHVARKCHVPRETIDSWMGLYEPIKGERLAGYPVWNLHRNKTSSLANLTAGGKSLDELGLLLNSVTDSVPKRLYMFRHVLHLATAEKFRSNPANGFSLRGVTAPSDENELLTQPGMLFELGDAAFGEWTFCVDGKWTKVHVAVTPEDFFRNTIDLAELEEAAAATNENGDTAKAGCKKKRKKKKSRHPQNDRTDAGVKIMETDKETQNATTNADEETSHSESQTAPPRSTGRDEKDITTEKMAENGGLQKHVEYAERHCRWLANELGLQPVFEEAHGSGKVDLHSADEVIRFLFDTQQPEPAFQMVEESLAISVFEAAMKAETTVIRNETKEWLRSCVGELVVKCVEAGRKMAISILNTPGVCVSAKTLCEAFAKLPKGRSNEYSNNLAKAVSRIKVSFKDEAATLLNIISCRVGKQTRKIFRDVLKKGEEELLETRSKSQAQTDGLHQSDDNSKAEDRPISHSDQTSQHGKKGLEAERTHALQSTVPEDLNARINVSLQWYWDLLERNRKERREQIGGDSDSDGDDSNSGTENLEDLIEENDTGEATSRREKLLSCEEVAEVMKTCVDLSEKQQTDVVCSVEKNMDLSTWDDESEWTIDITEQAHKWFRKHVKRQHGLCDRVIRRLKLLAVGRWPYVLCKPLKTKASNVKLYESKIDSGSRIIWEVAVAFSPRRSRAGHSFCEQVIRVWDVVQDHDNLSRSIDRAIERIEKSHLRGQECMIYSELEDFRETSIASDRSELQLPRVFSMKQDVAIRNDVSPDKTCGDRHYPPASDDPCQFTLLKFYELDVGAIKLLLDEKDENCDLPFTPGPKEHEIIHYQSKPERSILLMGRSGTGKTTCLVFRMWAQFMAYAAAEGSQPRQMFVTRNVVLKNEVESSFQNMGLAWRRKVPSADDVLPATGAVKFPRFLTASEWLERLDNELPGDHFFTPKEVEERIDCRQADDAVKRGVEALFADENLGTDDGAELVRKEMTFTLFKKELWRKLNSRTKSDLDPALVWLEIKSYIKGSVAALHIEAEERSLAQRRFLSRDQYISFPRKMSRIDSAQRHVVYDLYEAYEKIKKERHYFDEMDVVYNLAGRVSLFWNETVAPDTDTLLPIDSLYVDEVQDFTQAELYLLTKLSRDPNNLMLAGDTAQSIAVGVGFRFTDVRQIFYESFGGIEPHLLQLTHNYRSHAGILRLAACVVELLYFFFSDSLDRLPPDLGLFTGPKPVIMETESPEELVLMLDGSKRETSRIEFGAHQVVIVRSEEAKQALPDEFGVDKDWVMTVQESKGLEFDDVLLYNFFTDSEAGDLWRVVSNYTENDVEEYYNDQSVKSSGVQRFDWDKVMEIKSRHLEFSNEKHKILETELKMLYTAISRARVNIFIAESDTDLSRPMFEYFKRRQVVETRATSGMDGVRVFGVGNSTVEDWRKRGEYYLQNAEGQRQKGCLRLAAKCFDNAGETKKRDYALALHSFIDMEEQDSASKHPRERQGPATRKRLYGIAAELLEARDVAFLDKAALCLLRTGDHEYARSAEMFELCARLSYSKRRRKGIGTTSDLASREQQYFAYAAKLFEKCATRGRKRALAIRAVQNYVCSGTAGFKHAAKLIEGGLAYLHKSFVELASLCKPLSEKTYDDDPTITFRRAFPLSKECEDIRNVMKKLAKIACRSYYSRDDQVGVEVALEMISSRPEKIQLLSSLGNDPVRFISEAPWATHPTYSKLLQSRGAKPAGRDGDRMDVTTHLIRELSLGNSHGKDDEIVRTLEERGRLLEAAEHLDHLVVVECTTDTSSRHKLTANAADLRARYIRLVLATPQWEQHRDQICSLLKKLTTFLEESSPQAAAESIALTTACATSRLNGTDMWSYFDQCQSSIMWRYESIMMVVSSRLGLTGLISQRPGIDYWQGVFYIVQTARQMQKAAIAVCRSRKADEVNIVAQIESYYELKQDQFDPNRFTTAAVTNVKLRQAFEEESDNTLDAPGTAYRLVVELSREKVHAVLAKHLSRKASKLLLLLENHLAYQGAKAGRPCESIRFGVTCKNAQKCTYSHSHLPKSAREHIGILQAQILCLSAMHALTNSAHQLFHDLGMGKALQDRYKAHIDATASALVAYLIDGNHFIFSLAADDMAEVPGEINMVVWRQSTLQVLSVWARENWRKLSGNQKRTHLIEVIRYWRILRLCAPDDATMTVEQALQSMERKNYVVQDIQHGKTDHFLDKAEENPGKVQLFSRMWALAVDNVEEDLFNSISFTETLIDRTSRLDGLKTLYASEQISLLEVNAISVFSAMSLRYSEAPNAQDLYIAIPEKTYMNCHLEGEGVNHSRGFGMPIRDVVEKACHTNYFECFAMCVSHLEFIAGTMLKNELMRCPKKDSAVDAGRFERAIFLSSFVCYNAVLFAVAGIAMSPEEAKDDLNKLPSIPLCGNIKSLLQKLREAVTGSDASERVRKVFAPQKDNSLGCRGIDLRNDKSTVWDLLQAVDMLLQRSEYSDKLVLCRLRNTGPQHMEVERLADKSRLASVLSVQFHEKSNVFSDQYKPSSHKFLLHQKPQEGCLSAFSRKSDERTALLVITRYARSWKEKSLQKGADSPATTHFQAWKKTLGKFVGMVKRWLSEQRQVLQSSAAAKSQYNPTTQATHTSVCPLSSIPNLWNDTGHLESLTRKWNLHFMAHSPVFDGIECSFCGIPYNYYVQQERFHWCMGVCPQQLGYSGSDAASQFNWQQLGMTQVPFPMGNDEGQYFRQHAFDSIHLANVQNYENHRETLAQEAAQLDTSFSIARWIIDICDHHLSPPEMASWYLNVAEEARYLLLELENSHQRLFYEGLPWPNPSLPMLIAAIHASSSQRLQDFLVWYQMEERRITQESLAVDERENEDVGDMGHPLELLNE